MKKLFATFALAALMLFAVGINDAQAQTGNVGQLVSGLITVNVGAINIGDITVTDLVDVNNVLNNNNIEALNNVLNNNQIASNNSNLLNNLLRNAKLITGNQIVVGVLSGGQFVIQTLPLP